MNWGPVCFPWTSSKTCFCGAQVRRGANVQGPENVQDGGLSYQSTVESVLVLHVTV